MTNKFVMRWLN